jgi:hypothetical protein
VLEACGAWHGHPGAAAGVVLLQGAALAGCAAEAATWQPYIATAAYIDVQAALLRRTQAVVRGDLQ